MDVFAAVDLERLRIIDAVEITIGLEFVAHAVDLPAFHFRLEIPAEHLQARDQLIADLDVGHFQRAFAEREARHQFLCRIGPDIVGALARQRPEFAGIFEADARDQFADRQAITGHHRAELMAGSIPADMPTFKDRHAGAELCRLERDRQPGKAGADHGDIDIQIERQPQALRRGCGIASDDPACRTLAHIVSYGPIARLSPCLAEQLVH